MWRIRSKLVQLFLEPRLELVGRDRHARMAADRELKHASIIEPTRAASHGYQPPSRAAQVGHSGGRWCLGRTGGRARHAARPDTGGLSARDRSRSIFVALAVLAGAFGAAVADSDEPAPRRTAGTPEERERVTPLAGREPATQPDGRDRQGGVAVSEQKRLTPLGERDELPRRGPVILGSTGLSARSTRWRWPICLGPRSGGMSSSRTSTRSSNSRACSRQGNRSGSSETSRSRPSTKFVRTFARCGSRGCSSSPRARPQQVSTRSLSASGRR